MANNKTDYTKPHTDLVELLPEPLRSDVNLSLFNNVFNRYLTKQEIEKVAGYIGRGNTAAIRPRQIHEQDVHRQAYQLQPIPYNKIGTIEHMTSWKDMQNELERLDVDMDAFSEWGATQKFNWVPPIDINKIINYRDYYWVDTENPNSIPQYITIRSTCATATAKFNFWDSLIEQHGSTFQISEILATDATPLTYTITEFIDTPDTIKIEGDVTTNILLGDFIDVVGSVNNDDVYRITATPTYSGVTNETLLLVDKPIVADTPASSALVSLRRFDKIVLPANTTLVGSPPVAITDTGNYTSLFTEGFVFFVRNSTNVDIDSTFVETVSSTYDADKKETTVTINQRVTDDTAGGEISLEEQFSLLEADMKCQCDDFGGWDISPWDDNPLEPLWGDSEDETGAPIPDGISDHENLIARISNTTPPVSGTGIEGELWYDTTANILYQNSAVPLTVSRTDQFVASGSPVGLVFDVASVISSDTIVTAEIISGSPSPVSLNISYTASGTSTTVTVLDSLSANDIIEITYETPVWTVVWRNFSLILEQTTGIDLWDLSLSCDTRPRITATEQWIVQNNWFHKNDVVNFTSVQRANQPIIEYDWDLELNEWTYVKHNWSYRALEVLDFEVSTIIPPRIELEKLVWWEYTEEGNPSPSNEIIFDDRYGDMTDYFVKDREIFFADGLLNTSYTVVSSSYKTAAADGVDAAFPYRTYVTFNKTLPVPTPYIPNNLSIPSPNAISIIPILTTHGDAWDDYSTHWLYNSVDDAVPAPHQTLNPFIDIDVTQTSVPYPPPVFNAIVEPLDFVSSNTITVTGGDFEVDWGDGSYIPYTSGAATAVASGTINVRSAAAITQVTFDTNTYTDINIDICDTLTTAFEMCRNLTNLISFNMAETPLLLSVFSAWRTCTSMTSFAAADTSSVTSFDLSWSLCQSLITFPTINTSSGTDFGSTWQNCASLLTMPPLDFSAAINVNSTWLGCDSLTSFEGPLNFVNVEGLNQAFRTCVALLWLPALPTSNCISFNNLLNGSNSITCLTSLDTTAPGAATTDMFLNATALVAPNATEQTALESGSVYVNAGTCP